MVSKKVKVVNSQGFHMRPVTTFVGAMGKYDSVTDAEGQPL